MSEQNRSLAERVELFSRATSEALNKAISEVLDAKGPWQLLYRLSRIVLLGLVLYTAWLLITLQPDLAKRMRMTQAQTLPEQVTSHQSQVQTLLRTAIESSDAGLHTLALLQWGGGSSITVLAADGRSSQLGLVPGEQPLLGVEMAEALGNVAMGLCASEPPEALPITSQPSSAGGGVALLCPVGCSSQRFGNGLLLGLYEQSESAPSARGAATPVQGPPRQQEQLLLIARRLGEVLNGA